MILPIALTTAGAATILNLWLAGRISQLRIARKIMIGDGGDPAMVARIRAQGNFVEYAPFAVLLIGLIEFARGTSLPLWLLAIAFLLARLAHPLGMDRPAPNPLRAGGILVSWLVLLALAAWALAIPYLGTAAPMELVPAG
ncbi:MAPEG family protein [Sphingomonas jatrophae]|uniref:MAPEG family protein n=1 Tax=Sphingomonas jatrophae TaxID=1166337 RepID=A0A1I6M672_9SPHN|nr:MAPEG family protein [Sphingomonas jatrophae]SFS11220.1 hypothetical protein SAMN05192580_3546 [Sphingomonas jatrophae]